MRGLWDAGALGPGGETAASLTGNARHGQHRYASGAGETAYIRFHAGMGSEVPAVGYLLLRAGTASEPKKLAYWRVAARRRDTVPGPTKVTRSGTRPILPGSRPERPAHGKWMALLTDIAAQEIRVIDRNEDRQRLQHRDPGQKFSTGEFLSTGTCVPPQPWRVKLDAISVQLRTRGPSINWPRRRNPTERLAGLEMPAPSPTSSLRVPVSLEVNYGNWRQRHATEVLSLRWGRHTARDLRGQPALRRHQGLLVILGVARWGSAPSTK